MSYFIKQGGFKMSLSGGTLTVEAKGVTKVEFPSTTAGDNIIIDLTGKSYTFNDDSHASSNLTNLGFGITEAVDWAEDMPFFVYFVNEDNTSANVGMFITRSPTKNATPAATYIHDKDGAAANDTKDSIFGAWADDAGKASKPCILVGALRMKYASGTTDWTVQALSYSDGIGENRLKKIEQIRWVFPAGQNGNEAGKYLFVVDGATDLAFTTQTAYYHLFLNGQVTYAVALNDRTANGTDSVLISLALPMSRGLGLSPVEYATPGWAITKENNVPCSRILTSANTSSVRLASAVADPYTAVKDDAFANANDHIKLYAIYQGFYYNL